MIKLAQLLLSISILVIIHELGHYIAARVFKIRVEKFYIFFNPWFSLFKKKIGETTWGLGWLPLGGYVKISGMIDESMDKEQMKQDPKPYEFRSKPTWQRFIVMIAGVIVNFIAAIFIYIAILYWQGTTFLPAKNIEHGLIWDSIALNQGFRNGDMVVKVNDKEITKFSDITLFIVNESPDSVIVKRENKYVTIKPDKKFVEQIIDKKVMPLVYPAFPWIIADIVPESAAEKAGLMKNDVIVKINNIKTPYLTDVSNEIKNGLDNEMLITVLRNGDSVNIKATPDSSKLGIYSEHFTRILNFDTINYTFAQSIPAGIKYGFSTLGNYVKQLKYVFTPTGLNNVGSFGAFAQLFEKKWDWYIFWQTTALISIILAFMNILPIPALDGGHVIFLVYEMITGKNPPQKVIEVAQIIGMILLFSLFFWAIRNDFVNYLLK
jgi:regulator of sigma E protease